MNSVGAIAANGEYQTLAALYDKDNKLLIPLAATGTGAGVFTLNLYSTVTSTAYISGIGRFYTDAAGTLGEATSMALTANALTTLYVRLSSGSAYVLVDNASAIPCFGSPTHGGVHYAFTEATNAPKINGMDISYLKYCTAIRIKTNLNLSAIKGSISGLTALTYLYLSGNLLTCSGSVAGLTALTQLYLNGNLLTCSGSVAGLTALTNLVLIGSLLACSGSVAGLTALTTLNLSGNLLTCSGSVAGLTSLTALYLIGNLLTCSGSVAGLTALTTLYLSGNLLTCSGSVAGLTALTYLSLIGTQLTCSGSVKELLKKLTNWYINGSGLSIYYETPDYFPPTIDRYYLASAAITSSMADQIFIDLAASSVMASGSNKLLAIPSPGGAVTSASLAARNTMTSRGFTVQVHS